MDGYGSNAVGKLFEVLFCFVLCLMVALSLKWLYFILSQDLGHKSLVN